ncbi:hypothetical protein [Symbioplanes lichenis]|uniref:hypothetical protein n=1 Tax=Symbioplanes lichenis TaxID=1629072 RepID=UPI0027395726|nr:hypothetical protein [Actinoplanes lichenis]
MSGDLFVARMPADAESIDDLAADFRPPPLGSLAEVRQRLADLIDSLDSTRAVVAGPGWTIELFIGADDPVESVALHVRGAGDDVFPAIAELATRLDARVLELSTGEFVTGAEGWRAFQRFRNSVTGAG